MYFQQQQPSFLEGLISGFMSQREKNKERDQQAKMYGDVASFGNNLNNLDYGGQTTIQDLASRSNPNSNYTNKTMENKVAQGLLPTGFNQSPPTTDMIGQGLFGQGSMQPPAQQTFFNMPQYGQGNIDLANRVPLKNADGSISTVRSMGVNIDGKEVLLPTIGPNGEDWTPQQAMENYKKTGQNLGTFDSPESSNQYAQSLHEQQDTMYNDGGDKRTPLMGKYAKENNPTKTIVSAPKTLQQQTAMIKSQIAPAMKELITKYPNVNPKELYTMLQQATNDKIAEHTQNYQQQQMNDLYQGFINEENPNKKAMYAARLKNMGYDVTTAYKEFAPDYVDKVVDSGDTQNLLSFDKKSGKYYDGGKLAKTVSPDARLNADTKILTTGMNNNTSIKVAGMRGERGGGGGKANHYEEGAGTKNGKRLDPVEKQKYAELYNQKLEDIWDSPTPEIRAQKIQQHAQDLNELGYYMDRDVENDLKAITG